MKDFAVVMACISPIVAAIIAAISNWALKLYEIRIAKAPKTAPDDSNEKHEKNIAKWRFFVFISNWVLIAYNVYSLISKIVSPSEHTNLDAFDISISVVTIVFCGRFLFFRNYDQKVMDTWRSHAATTDRHSEQIRILAEAVESLSKKTNQPTKHKRNP